MKKIMFYINAIHDGGAERVMINLADYFSRQGYKTILVTSFRDTWEYTVPNAVKRITLEEHEIKQSKLKRNITRIKRLRKLCKDEKPDILVSFMAEPNFRAILATLGLPVKNLISVRNDPDKEYAGRVGHIVGKYLLPFADGCVFQTKEAKNWFPKRLQKKSRIIYNAVKEDFYHVERHPVPGEIVTCGRLEEQKNHALLIAAFSKVVERYPEARLKADRYAWSSRESLFDGGNESCGESIRDSRCVCPFFGLRGNAECTDGSNGRGSALYIDRLPMRWAERAVW